MARRLAIVACAAAAMIATLLGVPGAAPPAHAALDDRPAYTWNMEGQNGDGESKWTLFVNRMVNQAAQPVVALQEAGAGPPPVATNTFQETYTVNQANTPHLAGLPGSLSYNNLPADARARQVRHTQWESAAGLQDVYFLQTDRQNGAWTGGRVNLAIVTPRAADDVVIIPSPFVQANGGARPSLGVRLGDNWYFDLHGLSGSGNDIPGLLNNIQALIA
jgi:hypothetical protein